MARPLRVEFEGAWYHGMNRGAARRRLFLGGGDFDRFLDLLGDVSEIYGVEVHAYCLMHNHYHLLVRTPEANLGRVMRHLNGVYAQYFNRRTGRDGPLFRGRYTAILVDSDAYLLQVSRYIHLNPVDAGFVGRAEHYLHSSYRAYLGTAPAPDWLIMRAVLEPFGSRRPRESYRGFVERGVDAQTLAFYRSERMLPVFGRDAFKHRVRRRLEGDRHDRYREVPDARRLRPRPSLSAIIEAASRAFGVDPSALDSGNRDRDVSLARSAALHLARQEAGSSLASAAARMGYRSYNSAATALTRFRRKLPMPELSVRLRQIRSLLYKAET